VTEYDLTSAGHRDFVNLSSIAGIEPIMVDRGRRAELWTQVVACISIASLPFL